MDIHCNLGDDVKNDSFSVSNKSTLQLTTKVQKANLNDLENLLQIKKDVCKPRAKSPFSSSEHTYDNLSVINQSSNENNNLETLTDKDWRILSMLGFPNHLNGPDENSNLKIDKDISPIDKNDFEEILLTEEDYVMDDSIDILDRLV